MGLERGSRRLFLAEDLFAGLAKTPFPVLVVEDGLIKVLFPEIGPPDLGKIELGISQLVEEEIADPVFAAGSDHEFRIGKSAGTEITLQSILVNGFHA